MALRLRRGPLRLLPRPLELVAALLVAPPLFLYVVDRAVGLEAAVEVGDDQVAVVLDELTGELENVDTPGVHVVRPGLEQVFLLDKSPKELVMEEKRYDGSFKVPYLLARDRDGSSFSFDRVVVQYAVLPDAAARVLADTGGRAEDAAECVRAFARGVLREELGRASAEEVVDPDVLRGALDRSQERLDALLVPRGIDVLQIAASKPSFARDYEQVIERRKVGNQELEHLRSKFELLKSREEAHLEAVREEKQLELDLLERQAERMTLDAERDAGKKRRAADLAYDKRVEQGRLENYRITKEAEAFALRARAEHEGFLAETRALESAGEAVIRQALIERLKSVELDVVPVRHEDGAAREGGRAYARGGDL